MDYQHIDRLARKALMLMEEVPYDSFGPRDAVRALPEWSILTSDERVAINDRLDAIITGKE